MWFVFIFSGVCVLPKSSVRRTPNSYEMQHVFITFSQDIYCFLWPDCIIRSFFLLANRPG